MANFAELNSDNVVLNMEVIDDANCSIDGVVNEAKGAEFLNNIPGKSGTAKYLTYWDEDNSRWLATGSSDQKTYVWNLDTETFSLLT